MGNGANVLATTTDIGRISSVNVSNPGFSYTESPTSEARANFIIKDITGVFAVGDTLTSHTGSVRSYDSTTQLLEVSIEDTIAIEGESKNVTSNEGMRLEDSLVDDDYVSDNLILNADLVYGENLVNEDGSRLLIDNLITTTLFITSENGESQFIVEHPNNHDGTDYEIRGVKFIGENSPIPIITDGSGAFIVLDADLEYEDDLVINQTNLSATILLEDPDPDLGIILLEDDTPDAGAAEGNDAILLDGTDVSSTDADEKLLLELLLSSVSEIFYGKDAIILDSTDAANGADENDKLFFEDGIVGPANIGEKIIFNATDANGTNDPSNLVVLESGTSDTLGSDIILEDATPGKQSNSDHIILNGSGFLTNVGDNLDLEDFTSVIDASGNIS